MQRVACQAKGGGFLIYRLSLICIISGISIILSGCSKESPSKTDADAEQSTQVEEVDLRLPSVSAPPLRTFGADDADTTIADETIDTVASTSAGLINSETTSPISNRDVGYEGLKSTINNIERIAMPVLSDRTKYFSPEVADQAIRQSRVFMKEIQNSTSVEKELRHEIWDSSIDLNSALTEMKDASAGPRYEELRAIVLQAIEKTQSKLLTPP